MIVYDLYCGLGGWSEAFIAEGYECIGFDIKAHDYGTGGYPGKLILRDVRSIHGSELKDAAVIVGSSPCQEFSYRAMPWKRAKALGPPYLGMELFNAQFRIQREASEAAGHHILMVVENVKGAEKWVGPAAWNYGSFYLWGDVPALMPKVGREQKFNPDGTNHPPGSWFAIANSKNRGARSVAYKSQEDLTRIAGKQAIYAGRSLSRKAARALIAKIPYPLALHIARVYKPEVCG